MEKDACIVRIWESTDDPIIFLLDAEANHGLVLSWSPIGQHGEASIGIMRQPYTRPATESETVAVVALYESSYDCKLKVYKRVNHKRLVKNWI